MKGFKHLPFSFFGIYMEAKYTVIVSHNYAFLVLSWFSE